jgi:hypothetical protein
MVEAAVHERPTVRMPAQVAAPMKLFRIERNGREVLAATGWRSAHLWLADRPELEGAQVVAL